MVAYNFKKQFADAVAGGTKRQTIRAERKDGRYPTSGDALQLYTGMRTKACRLLRTDVCEQVRQIEIRSDESVYIDGIECAGDRLADFVGNDGFDTLADFFAFFKDTHGLPFRGIIINW